jgi:hypothetical protein
VGITLGLFIILVIAGFMLTKYIPAPPIPTSVITQTKSRPASTQTKPSATIEPSLTPILPTRTPGVFGNALKIVTATGYGTIPYAPTLDIRKEITIEAWIRVEKFSPASACTSIWADTCGYIPVISQAYPKSAAGNYTFAVGPKGLLFAFERIDSRCMGYADIPTGKWVHIAVVHTYGQGETTRMYINGQVVEKTDWLNDVGERISGNDLPPQNSESAYWIGRFGNLPGGESIIEIDELKIWGIVRSQEDILNSMKSIISVNTPGLLAYWGFDIAPGNMTVPDLSGNEHDIQLLGNVELYIREDQ